MDAWKKLQMDMEVARLHMRIDTQQKILEASKSMWDKHNKNNSAKSEMLTIRNINKVVGKTFHMRGNYLAIGTIFDVYEFIDNRYEFRITIETPDGRNSNIYRLNLNRNKIPYPIGLKDCWELSYEEKPNQFIVESIQKSELMDMREVERKISILMDKILAR